uniref:Uncharacterized protein n=1 Tax=Arundo donax TaxID=35708 RepID=A0A0A8YPX3_ARUDO
MALVNDASCSNDIISLSFKLSLM